MSRNVVYLAGPITGLTYAGATSWRDHVAANLAPGIFAASPLRGKDYLEGYGELRHQYHDHPMSRGRAILVRDHFDVRVSGAVLVNLLGTTEPSLGTVMEVAWAYAYRVPVVLVIEDEGNLHDHVMIEEATMLRTPGLDDGIAFVNRLLAPYAGAPPVHYSFSPPKPDFTPMRDAGGTGDES